MALRYLLDTSSISHLMRSPAGGVGRRIAEGREDSICTSIIVAAELRCGAARLIEQTGAATLAPHLLEWRAELAAALGDEKSLESLLRQAIDGFEAIGGPLQAARIRRSMGVDSTIDVTLAERNVQEEAAP